MTDREYKTPGSNKEDDVKSRSFFKEDAWKRHQWKNSKLSKPKRKSLKFYALCQ